MVQYNNRTRLARMLDITNTTNNHHNTAATSQRSTNTKSMSSQRSLFTGGMIATFVHHAKSIDDLSTTKSQPSTNLHKQPTYDVCDTQLNSNNINTNHSSSTLSSTQPTRSVSSKRRTTHVTQSATNSPLINTRVINDNTTHSGCSSPTHRTISDIPFNSNSNNNTQQTDMTTTLRRCTPINTPPMSPRSPHHTSLNSHTMDRLTQSAEKLRRTITPDFTLFDQSYSRSPSKQQSIQLNRIPATPDRYQSTSARKRRLFDDQSSSTLFTLGLSSLRSAHVRSADFQFDQLIGCGSYADVYQCRDHKTNKLYAIKKYKSQMKSIKQHELCVKKISYLTLLLDRITLEWPDYILKHYNAWHESGRLYIQTELCSQGDIREYFTGTNYIKLNLTELNVWQLIYDISTALSYIHKRKLIHFDIKPANIYVNSESQFILGDLGSLTLMSDYTNDHNDECDGLFMAPELLSNHSSITCSIDIYAFGLTLYSIATDKVIRRTNEHTLQEIQLDWTNCLCAVSDQLKSLIGDMTSYSPNDRPQSYELVGIANARLQGLNVQ